MTTGVRRGMVAGLVLLLAGSGLSFGQGLGEPKQLKDGVVRYSVTFKRDRVPMTVWIYLPKGAKGTKKPGKKLPCVLVAPAGAGTVFGMNLTDGDSPEHIPYVKAGFVVVSYTLDGLLKKDANDDEYFGAMEAFVRSQAGMLNARAALDHAIKHAPIDAGRIYSSGHSSAGAASLRVAYSDKRIRACVAYAPVTDIETRLGLEWIAKTDGWLEGFAAWTKRWSPLRQVTKLRCPLYLFQSTDDKVVTLAQNKPFLDAVRKHRPVKLTYVEVKSGGHYKSMINVGIPGAIKWLKKIDQRADKLIRRAKNYVANKKYRKARSLLKDAQALGLSEEEKQQVVDLQVICDAHLR